MPLICLEWAYVVEGRREFGGLDGTFALVAHILTIPWFEVLCDLCINALRS